MPTEQSRQRIVLFAAAATIAGAISGLVPAALAQVAGQPIGLSATTQEPTLERAEALLRSGRLIEARHELNELSKRITPERAGDPSVTRALELARTVERRLQAADPIEISLQKAEFAAATGDLRMAERHASVVAAKAGIGEWEKKRAQDVLDAVQQLSAQAAANADRDVQAAADLYEAGKFAESKRAFLTIQRSGATLSEATRLTVDRYTQRLYELERAQGMSFEALEAEGGADMTVLQPGRVRRGGSDAPAENAPAPAGESTSPIVVVSAQPDQPAQPPANQPVPPIPAEQDLIEAARRAEAQRILAEADLAFQEGRLSEAQAKYQRLVSDLSNYLTPEQSARTTQRLEEARIRAGRGAGLSDRTIQDDKVLREKASAAFANFLEQARAALTAGDPERARELAAEAQLEINQAQRAFSAAEHEQYSDEVQTLRREIDRRSEEIMIREGQARDRTQQAREAEERQSRLLEKERKVNEAIDRARALQAEMKYEEALQVVEELLFRDPINPSGLLLRDVLNDLVLFRKFNEVQRQNLWNHAWMQIDNVSAMVPPRGIVDYPTDWPAKTFQRGELAAYAETPENRRTLAELERKSIPVKFNDNSLADVLGFIETVALIDIDVDWPSLDEIGIEREALVTMNLSRDIPVNVVLDRILEKVSQDDFVKAGWAVDHGVVMVASDKDLRKRTTLVTYDITDLLFDVPNFDEAPELDLQSVLQASQGGGGGGGGQSPFRDDQDEEEDGDRPTREDKINRIVEIIQSNVDFEGWRDNGGETGALQELNGTLIITNTPRNHREIVGLLSKLREIRSMQINVETKFLLVNQDWFEQIGFDIDVYINGNNNQVRTARGNDPTIQPGDFFDRGRLRRDVTGAVNAIDTDGDGIPDDDVSQGVINPTSFSPIGFGQDSLGIATGLATDNSFATGILQGAPALGIAGQFLDDVQVDFLIQATQADRRTVQLTAPRLTFTNGQTSNIYVVTQQAFVSDLEPQTADSAVGFDPTVDVVSEGVTMLVEGVVSADRRYVTMNVDAGIGRIDGFEEQPVSAVAGGQLVNSADTQSFIQLPTVTITRVRTTVTVPDEGTVLLGGQRLVTELEIETGVPVLSKIPILNRFFTNRIESKEEQTLLILIKPTILIQAEQEEKHSPGINDALNNLELR